MNSLKLWTLAAVAVACFTILVDSESKPLKQTEAESMGIPPLFEKEKHSPRIKRENFNNEPYNSLCLPGVWCLEKRKNIGLTMKEDETGPSNLSDGDHFDEKLNKLRNVLRKGKRHGPKYD